MHVAVMEIRQMSVTMRHGTMHMGMSVRRGTLCPVVIEHVMFVATMPVSVCNIFMRMFVPMLLGRCQPCRGAIRVRAIANAAGIG